MHFLMMPFVFILQCWVFSWDNFLFGAPIIDKTVWKITTLIYLRFHFSPRTSGEMLWKTEVFKYVCLVWFPITEGLEGTRGYLGRGKTVLFNIKKNWVKRKAKYVQLGHFPKFFCLRL